MIPFLDEVFGNPSSLHDWGDAAREAVEAARAQVAQLIGTNAEEIIFTGSGTESNNFAIKGLALAQETKVKHSDDVCLLLIVAPAFNGVILLQMNE